MTEPQPTNGSAGKIRPVSTKRACMILMLVLLIIISIPVAFGWFMSPLGMGFHQWPDDPEKANQALLIYVISWIGGIPLLIIGQLAAIVLAFKDRVDKALASSAISLMVFLILVGFALWSM